MTPPPVISIVMPVFNGAPWLADSLASIRRQGMTAVELILVDDGSTDDSGRVARQIAPEAHYHRQENRGPSAARNAGVARSRGALIAFLDQDDVWPEGSLALRERALAKRADALFVLGRTRFVGPAPAPDPWVAPNLGAGLFRREIFARVGPFNEAHRLVDDVEWFLRIREAGLPYTTLAEETLHYRRCTGGATSGRSWRDPELRAAVRASLARRRLATGQAGELPLLSGSPRDPRAASRVHPG